LTKKNKSKDASKSSNIDLMKEILEQARESQDTLKKANEILERELQERRNQFKEKETVWRE
jgi:hypothetical protein